MRKKGATQRYRDANGLNRSGGSGGVSGCGFPEVDPPPGGVLLGTVPLAPRACYALTPRELAARLRRYEKRAEKRLPLFRRGRAAKDQPKYPQCWACGAVAWGSTDPAASRGWSTRRAWCSGAVMVESYCVGCMDRWGWPEHPLWAGLRRGE